MSDGTHPGRCLIIGGAGGTGRALGVILRERGWDLTIAGRREDATRSAASELGADAATLDAGDFESVASLAASLPNLRGMVNLAGSILLKAAHQTSASEFDQTIHQNLRSAFAVVRAAGQAMRSGGGSVVLLSSCAASVGLVNHEAISAAKAGVEGLARSAAATYATNNLRFNVVAPGLVNTPMASRITSSEPALKASIAMHPLGRIGTPADVARVVAMLLDPDNAWITGQVIGVDGGLARVRGR